MHRTRLVAAVVSSSILLVLAGGAFGEDQKHDPANIVKPFNGKNLDGWKLKGPADRSKWVVGLAKIDPDNPRNFVVAPCDGAPGEMINAVPHSLDIYTEQKFGDCTISLGFMVPRGSNSGVYAMGEYEVQILDSYGKKQVGTGDLGGIYAVAAPRVNAARKPGEWQTLFIDFKAPKFKNGKKIANARFVKIVLNDQVIHENVEMTTRGGGGVTGKEAPTGPLMFQGNHGVVAYRNIKITLPPE